MAIEITCRKGTEQGEGKKVIIDARTLQYNAMAYHEM